MRIATYNVNSVRTRLPSLLNWIKKNKPDILCLQETKVQDDSFPKQPLINEGYDLVFRGEKAYNGVCIISKSKFSKVEYGLDGKGATDESRMIHAKIGPLHIINTYVPQGREITHGLYQYKLAWFQRLRQYFSERFTKRSKVLWVGDMNVAREAIDLHNPETHENHVCFHKDVRDEFNKTLELGFEDVFRTHHPEPNQYTFYDYRTTNAVKRNMGWRIDYILATPPLASKCSDCFIDLAPRLMSKCSDHTFLVADFDV